MLADRQTDRAMERDRELDRLTDRARWQRGLWRFGSEDDIHG